MSYPSQSTRYSKIRCDPLSVGSKRPMARRLESAASARMATYPITRRIKNSSSSFAATSIFCLRLRLAPGWEPIQETYRRQQSWRAHRSAGPGRISSSRPSVLSAEIGRDLTVDQVLAVGAVERCVHIDDVKRKPCAGIVESTVALASARPRRGPRHSHRRTGSPASACATYSSSWGTSAMCSP